jgi:hypothetical protein
MVPFSPASPAAQKTKLYFMVSPISYRIESGFSWVTSLLSKVRNYVDVVKRDCLRLSLTTPQTDIQKLASVHQARGKPCQLLTQ